MERTSSKHSFGLALAKETQRHKVIATMHHSGDLQSTLAWLLGAEVLVMVEQTFD